MCPGGKKRHFKTYSLASPNGGWCWCRLEKDIKIRSLEEIYLFSQPIKKSELNDFFQGASLKDQDLKNMLVQKQTEDRIQGICHHWELQWTCRSGVQHWKRIATTIQGPSSWPSSILSLCGKAAGQQDLQATHHSLRGEQTLWLSADGLHLCPQGHWYCLSPCAQEAVADDQYPQPLHLSQGLHHHPGQLRQGHIRCHLSELQLSHPWPLEIDPVHQVFLSGIHWPSYKDPR